MPYEPKNPKVTVEIYPERREAQTVYDFRGTQTIPDRPALLTCDFCNRDADRLWEYRHRAVCVDLFPGKGRQRMMSAEPSCWCACVFCRPLFEAGEFETLAARVLTMNPTTLVLGEAALARLYGGISDARDGTEGRLWSSGDLRPGKR